MRQSPELVENVGVDPAVQLVHVHGAQAGLDAVIFSLEAGERRLVLFGLVDVAFPQPFSDWLESLIIEPETTQQRGKPLKEHFLEKTRALASALLVIGASRLLLVFLFVMGNLHWVRLFEPSRADAVDLEHGLGEIDPDRANLHVDAPLM